MKLICDGVYFQIAFGMIQSICYNYLHLLAMIYICDLMQYLLVIDDCAFNITFMDVYFVVCNYMAV